MPIRAASAGVALAVLVGALPARAAQPPPGVPGAGEGTVALLGGARWIPQGGFLDDLTAAGYRPWKTVAQPGFLLALGYAPEVDFQVTIDLGYGLDKIHLTQGDLSA